MKILITGGCGFVGANLALFLCSKGFDINTLDNLSRKGSKYNLSLLKKKELKTIILILQIIINSKNYQNMIS